jgi:catechol 2,3-dioxygenase-like lactoylglutathione lyase family enzyme
MQYAPHHTAISVRDLDISLAFYSQLGYQQVHRYDEDDGSMAIVHLKLGTSFLELFAFTANKQADQLDLRYANNLEDIGVKHIALSVNDIKAALHDLKSKGFADESTTITMGRTKVQYFFIKDPDGMWVEVINDNRYS